QGRKVIDYASATNSHWNKFGQEIDTAIRNEILNYKTIPLNDPVSLSKLWTQVSNIIMNLQVPFYRTRKYTLTNAVLYRNTFRHFPTNFTLLTNVLDY